MSGSSLSGVSGLTEVYLGLGSNIDREQHIRSAVSALAQVLREMRVSTVYESAAVGFAGAPFYNLVVAGRTDMALVDIISWLKKIEDANGRDRSGPKFGPRTLDIDLLTYADLQGMHQGIELPRPETLRQAYVLRPLAELAPELVLPGLQQSCQQLWQRFPAESQPLTAVDLSFTG